jgi:hypothetical protein
VDFKALVAAADAYPTARPFPHAVLDNVFDDSVLTAAVAEFPGPDDPAWKTYAEAHEQGKQEITAVHNYEQCSGILSRLVHPTFVASLEALSGIRGLVPDVWGAGMHQSAWGAHLDLHADFTRNPQTGLYRRLNVLLFLNPEYHTECGGQLVLGVGPDQIAIDPTWGRLVVFSTSPTSWHGHPDRWQSLMPRRSLAMYFYSQDPPPDYPGDRSTEWYDR